MVVKELKASASVREQMHFLEEAQPYRWVRGWRVGEGRELHLAPGPCHPRQALCCALPPRPSCPPPPPSPCPALPCVGAPSACRLHRALKHSNLLQCLAQCAEVTPYLLVMEFCPMVSVHPPAPVHRAERGPRIPAERTAELGPLK